MRNGNATFSITKQHTDLDMNFISIKKHETEITLNFFKDGTLNFSIFKKGNHKIFVSRYKGGRESSNIN